MQFAGAFADNCRQQSRRRIQNHAFANADVQLRALASNQGVGVSNYQTVDVTIVVHFFVFKGEGSNVLPHFLKINMIIFSLIQCSECDSNAYITDEKQYYKEPIYSGGFSITCVNCKNSDTHSSVLKQSTFIDLESEKLLKNLIDINESSIDFLLEIEEKIEEANEFIREMADGLSEIDHMMQKCNENLLFTDGRDHLKTTIIGKTPMIRLPFFLLEAEIP